MTDPEGLEDAKKMRLSSELEQVERQRAEALRDGLSLGGGLGQHEQMMDLAERAEAIRQQLGHPVSAPLDGRGRRAWVGWAVLVLACVGIVVGIWVMGSGGQL